MAVVSKVIDVPGKNTVDVQPKNTNYKVTAIVTSQGLGIKFVNSNDEETDVTFVNNEDFNTKIHLTDDNWLALETTSRHEQTGFVSLET